MNCPLCAATVQADAADCRSCGVIFAKLREKWDRERKETEAARAAEQAPVPSPPLDPRLTPMRLRLAAGAVVAAWMLGLGVYVHLSLTKTPRGTAAGVRLRDVEVYRSSSALRAEPPPPRVDAEPAPPPGAPAPDPRFDD